MPKEYHTYLTWGWGKVVCGLSACLMLPHQQDSFHLGVDFSSYFFASPQHVDQTPYRINLLSLRLQFKMVAIVTWSHQKRFYLLNPAKAKSLYSFTTLVLFPRMWSIFLPFWSAISTIISSHHFHSPVCHFKITTTYIYHHVYAIVFIIQHSSPLICFTYLAPIVNLSLDL